MPKFSPGDVVRLKSGGRRMTVARSCRHPATGARMVVCYWEDSDRVKHQALPPAALEADDVPAPSANEAPSLAST
ncbi:MAG TPA: DUF2158 domain-containing protein [Urbifossiella sp.]|nr:DUF2158 domain-containing protein [Urbifossiella sp.]